MVALFFLKLEHPHFRYRLCDAVALALRGSPGPAGGLSYSGWSLQDNCTVHISTADARHRSDSLVLAIVEAYR